MKTINVEPMKDVAKMIRAHLEGIVAWAQTRQTKIKQLLFCKF
jgi:hypothetical protein